MVARVAEEETVGEVTVVALFYENCKSQEDLLRHNHRMYEVLIYEEARIHRLDSCI